MPRPLRYLQVPADGVEFRAASEERVALGELTNDLVRGVTATSHDLVLLAPILGHRTLLQFASLSSTGGTDDELLDSAMDPSVNFDDLKNIRAMWPGKFVVEGVQNLEDSKRLADLGVDGILLSNHDGRQLDRTPIPLHLLPDVVREVGNDTEAMVDIGIMNGADIVASIALGLKFTGVGRAYLYGLMAAVSAPKRTPVRTAASPTKTAAKA